MADLLDPDAVHQSLAKLDGWTGTTEGLAKDYRFGGFSEAVAFVNRVAELAEEANHHPDIRVSYNRVRLDLVTHSAGGVTQKDLELAGRIDETEPR